MSWILHQHLGLNLEKKRHPKEGLYESKDHDDPRNSNCTLGFCSSVVRRAAAY